MKHRHYGFAAGTIIATAMGAAGCIPPYSDFQSARLIGPGRAEITPFYSAVWDSSDGETEKLQDHFGVQVATGLATSADIRFRYERVKIEGDGVNVVGAGPKLALVRDHAALFVPVGTAFGEDVESSELWQAQPTLLLTATPNRSVEINGSAKALLWLNNDSDALVAFNLGLGLRPSSGQVWLRPEVGYLMNPGESGYSFHAGFGLSFVAGGR